MNKLLLILFSLGLILLYSCSPKITTKSKVKYEEDLTKYAPQFTSVDSEEEETKVLSDDELRGPYQPPSNDITRPVNSFIDGQTVENLEKQVTYYTIQVYSGPNREEANNSRQKVYRVLPEEMPRMEYVQPNFKVKVGKYVDRIDAYKTFAKLKKAFPGAILVPRREYVEN